VFNRIFGRKDKGEGDSSEPAHERPKPEPFPDGVTCGAGCTRREGYRCAYRDATGRRCIYWCPDHSVYANGRTWCQRHANSVKWLQAQSGSIFEINNTAAIDDRSPNLAGMLVDELDGDVSAYLQACFGRWSGIKIVTDANIRASQVPKGRVERTADGPVVLSEGGRPAWDRGWGVFSPAGYLARVVLRVTATEPPVVHLYVNGAPVLSRVPDWIANRGRGTDPATDHANFRAAVMAAVQASVVVRHPDPG
jgi:hypothetical protein